MQGSKLLSLLKSLSPEEFQKISKFIRSPYFTSSKDVVRLYDYLRKYYPNLESDKLEKEQVFKKLFPKATYSDIKLRNLMRKLTHIVEEYLLHLEINEEDYGRKKRLVKIYYKRNLFDLFEKGTTKLLAELDKQPFRDSVFFYEKFELLYDYYFHPATNKQGDKGNMLLEVLKNLEYYSALEHIQVLSELKNRTLLFREKLECNSENTVIPYPENNLMYELVSILNQLYETGEEILYTQLKEKYLNNFQNIRRKDTLFIFFSLLNYVIKQIPYHEINSLKEAFEWYQFGIEKSILVSKNQINSTTFLNVVVAGSKLKEFVWVRQFMDQYEPYLDIKLKEDIKMLGYGFWYFHKGEYDTSVDLLLDHKFSKALHQITAKALLVRTYFELYFNNSTFHSLAEDSCEAFEMYIRRNAKINEQRAKSYLNFVQFTKKLIKVKNQTKPTNQKETLITQLAKLEPVIHRTWIEEKINAL